MWIILFILEPLKVLGCAPQVPLDSDSLRARQPASPVTAPASGQWSPVPLVPMRIAGVRVYKFLLPVSWSMECLQIQRGTEEVRMEASAPPSAVTDWTVFTFPLGDGWTAVRRRRQSVVYWCLGCQFCNWKTISLSFFPQEAKCWRYSLTMYQLIQLQHQDAIYLKQISNALPPFHDRSRYRMRVN
jgi:hypothetical protein